MLKSLSKKNIAIVGGGRFCQTFLHAIFSQDALDDGPRILGVSDLNEQAPGYVLARDRDLFVTQDYTNLYGLAGLDLIIEMTQDEWIGEVIKKTKPSGVRFMDHFEARSNFDYLQIEKEKARILETLPDCRGDVERITELINGFWQFIKEIAGDRNRYSEKIRKDLAAREWVMAQIVQGSTIPTFVINQDHMVTHWNRACEKLTGYSALEIVGTNKQWKPFRREKRPIMADLILDGVTEEEVWRYYGTKWRKSALIEGAYEAEEHFPHLGANGLWLFFTAAPIKTTDGKIVGAIETLWDKTADKMAEVERERHNQALSAKARELVASERAMAQIVQGSTVPTFVINKDHEVTHWNRALERLTGRPAESVVGTKEQWAPFWEKKRPTMADAIMDQLGEEETRRLYGDSWRRSQLIDGAYEAEGFFPRLGENGKWCFFTAAPIKTEDGTIVGAIETLWDRTEYKRAEEEKERHYTEIAGLCSIYTAMSTSLDLDHRITVGIREIQNFLFTDGVCVFLREKDGEFRLRHNYGTSDDICLKTRRVDEGSMVYRAAMSDKVLIFDELPELGHHEITLLKAEGIHSLAYVPITTKDRKTFGVIRIASRKPNHFSKEGKGILELVGNRIGVAIENSLLHEKYIKSEEKYRTLFNNDPNPIFIIDSRTLGILDVNHRALDCYGYSRTELIFKPFLELGDHKDVELATGLNSISEDQSLFFSKKRHYKKGGIPFYVNISLSYATYRGNDVLIAATTDVTESVEKETQLIQASKMTTLGQMAAGIAHEINQPLNVIQVCADFFLKMLKKGEAIQTEDLKVLANDISDNVQRAAGIIRHMRDFSRQSESVRSKVNINDPIRDVFKVMGHQLKSHHVNCDLDLAPALPPIMAEHNRLEQVFINLVSNAVDAMDEKGLNPGGDRTEKRLGITSFVRGDQVVVTVSDTGVGMPGNVMDKIFEPFFTTKEVGKGTGLGVSISYGIVKDYDGSIRVDSAVGKGTTFTLTFPTHDSQTGIDDA